MQFFELKMFVGILSVAHETRLLKLDVKWLSMRFFIKFSSSPLYFLMALLRSR